MLQPIILTLKLLLIVTGSVLMLHSIIPENAQTGKNVILSWIKDAPSIVLFSLSLNLIFIDYISRCVYEKKHLNNLLYIKLNPNIVYITQGPVFGFLSFVLIYHIYKKIFDWWLELPLDFVGELHLIYIIMLYLLLTFVWLEYNISVQDPNNLFSSKFALQ